MTEQMTDFSWQSLTIALPEIFLACASLLLLVVGVIQGNERTRFLSWAVIAAFGVAALLLLGLDWEKQTALSDMFVLDRFAGLMKLFVIIGIMTSLAISVRYIYVEDMARFEYPLLMLFAGIGMLVMISANSLLTMYLGLELQSLALYVLASFRKDHSLAAEAGVKYFILGALASGMLLFGSSLVYGYSGSLNFDVIALTMQSPDPMALGLIIGLVFVLTGLAFKISAVPFHMWTPDVYEGAPTSVTAFFAIVPKLAAMALIMRLLFGPFGAAVAEWQQVIWFLSMASMLWGAFAGLIQQNIKRLLAYSSIGNMGFALVGVASGSLEGISAVMLYLVIYMIMTAGVFSVVLVMRRGGIAAEKISDFAGLSKTNPLIAYAMAILMFSMAGIPPLAGFFGKMLVFKAAISSGLYILAVAGIMTSVVAAYYYLRIIKVMFFDDAIDPIDSQVAFSRRAVLLISVLFVIFFIFSPDLIIQTCSSAASSLFLHG